MIMLLDARQRRPDARSPASATRCRCWEASTRAGASSGPSPTTGVAEIVNDVDIDPRRVTEHTTIKALIGAAMRVGERVTGVIALGSTVPMAYTAAELKLLNTLALQAATAMENARLFERTVQAAAGARAAARAEQGDGSRARQARKRARPGRPHPGGPLPGRAAGAARLRPGGAQPAGPPVRRRLLRRDRPVPVAGGDRTLLCVADVSGKGLPAALVMSNMQATLRALLGRTAVAAGAGRAVERAALRLDCAGEVRDRGAGRSRSGHRRAPLRRRRPRRHADPPRLGRGGDAVVHRHAARPAAARPALRRNRACTWRRATRWCCSPTACPRRRTSSTRSSARPACSKCCAKLPAEPAAALIDRVMAAIDAFVGGAPQFDDITLLVARRLPDPA